MSTDHIKFNQLAHMGNGNDLEKTDDQILAPKVFEGMCFL